MDTSQPPAVRRSALIGWRVLALVYDLFPALGLWFLVGVIALAMQRGVPVHGDTVAGWMELLALWAVTGVYAIASWRGGGQTLGMRPWHLRVTAADGGRAEVPALIRRYAMGTVSLLLLGAGFWWAWVDRDGLTWHDRFSGTRLLRSPKKPSRDVP
jgi:RDD family.